MIEITEERYNYFKLCEKIAYDTACELDKNCDDWKIMSGIREIFSKNLK